MMFCDSDSKESKATSRIAARFLENQYLLFLFFLSPFLMQTIPYSIKQVFVFCLRLAVSSSRADKKTKFSAASPWLGELLFPSARVHDCWDPVCFKYLR